MTINYQQPFYQNPYGLYPYPQGQVGPLYNSYPVENYSTPSYYNEQSYIENILRLNRGKIATVYMNFEGSQWGSKIFRGEIIAAGRDHIILKDNQNKVNYLLLTIYLSYVTFDENTAPKYDAQQKEMTT